MNVNEFLVGGFKHDFYFPIYVPFHIWDVILPN